MALSTIPVISPWELFEGTSFEASSRYRLLRRLGAGGMGDVWLAERRSSGGHHQKVAVKFLRATSGGSLAEEALRMSCLSHDNIVPFLDSGHDHLGRLFVVMAYIDGYDLSGVRELAHFDADKAYRGELRSRMPEPIVGFLLFMVLRALHHAHTFDFADGVVGLVHRDVSPGNILVDRSAGFVKLTDFGVAVPQDSGETEIAGKVPYMSPEVLQGEKVDSRADIYSLGIVGYELLTGLSPNCHPSQMGSVLASITGVMLALEEPLHEPREIVEGVDPELSRIIAKMLALSPQDRYASAEAVLADLTIFLYDKGVGPTSDSLHSYLEMLHYPQREVTPRVRRTLSFLGEKKGRPDILSPYELVPAAAALLRAGRNPARG
ncbi:MAG: serine/threonine protein kinase [Myxococcota bacterium]|nr:serine/threonine protein kinase [Myxococcota bacterium]